MKSRKLLLPVTYRLLTTTLLAVMLFGGCHAAPE
jgi:hypothetical protein